MSGDVAGVAFELESWRLVKRDDTTGRVFEIVEGAKGQPERVLLRRAGIAPAESYADYGVGQIMKMRMTAGGFDGETTYDAGETLELAEDHAKRAFLAGHGRPVGKRNRLLSHGAAADTFNVTGDDLLLASASIRAAIDLARDTKE